MDISSNNITNLATLTFLTNPLYSRELSKNMDELTNISMEEKKFYKKRLNQMHKQLMNEEIVDKNVKRVHDEFIKAAINYLKMTDTKDILQEEYIGHEDSSTGELGEFNLNDVNKTLTNISEPKNTLDNFVTSKKVNLKPLIPPPKQKKINLTDEKLKTKGIKKKKKKNKE